MKIALKTVITFIAGFFLLAGCSEYDDSTLTGRVDDLENRVSELEQYIEDLNNTIQGVSSIVRALQDEERVVSVEPLADGTGYKIVFSDGSEATIKNGEEPSIGIQQDTDGIWYWTVDGEFLLDGSDKIPAINAPEFKIEGGQLYYRINGGEWTVVPGAETGFGLVQDVEETEDDVTFILSTGESITIPKVQNFALVIDAPSEGIMGGQRIYVNYTVTAGDAETVVKAICDAGFTATVSGNAESGSVTVTAPAEVPAEATILVVAVNGKGQMSGKILSFAQGEFSLVTPAATIGSQGGQVVLQIKTNMDYNEPMIDPSANWITRAPETKTVRTDELVYNVAAYDGSNGSTRTGNIYVSYGNGEQETFTITQLNTEVVSGGEDDFETFNAISPNFMTYVSSDAQTDAGWHVNQYCLIMDKTAASNWDAIDTYLPIICGTNEGAGELYSPDLEGGCGTLTIKYGTLASSSQLTDIGFKVTVSNGVSTESFEIRREKADLAMTTVYEVVQDVNLTGNFTITFTNLCVAPPAMALFKYQDSVGILSVEWTGYSE